MTGSATDEKGEYQAPGNENMSDTNVITSENIVGAEGGFLSTANNPVICVFHLIFKGASVVAFLFLNLFIDEDIATFLVVVILCAVDFWTVKNVTGRLLVNLRWWSEIDEAGEEHWIYESDDGKKTVGRTDSFVFWSALYGYPLLWIVFGFVDFVGFKFLWIILCIICFTLSFTNAQGYYSCQQDQKTKLSAFV